jgi:hypothetical protein
MLLYAFISNSGDVINDRHQWEESSISDMNSTRNTSRSSEAEDDSEIPQDSFNIETGTVINLILYFTMYTK